MQSGSAKPNCESAFASARRCGLDGAGAAGAGAGAAEEDEEDEDEPLILGEVGQRGIGAVASGLLKEDCRTGRLSREPALCSHR